MEPTTQYVLFNCIFTHYIRFGARPDEEPFAIHEGHGARHETQQQTTHEKTMRKEDSPLA